jgi:signal transduction histidine kinase
MAQRLSSLKTRTAFAMSCVIVAVLVVNALYLILGKRAEIRQEIVARADLFARLTGPALCAGFERHQATELGSFAKLVRDYLALEPNIDRVRILSAEGELLSDSAAPGLAAGPLSDRALAAAAADERGVSRVPSNPADERQGLEIVAPCADERGRHLLSVAYHVSFRTLGPSIAQPVYATAGLTLVSIVLAVWVAVTLTSRITRPLEELTTGAQSIAEGHFDRRLAIRSGDELQILAEAFNHMSMRLKENVEELEESNKKLAGANEELKELDRMKSDLLANVSHELRTPLTAIKGYTDYILDRKLGAVTEKQEKGLLVVQRNLDRLSKSIGALLDFSRMDMGRVAVHLQPFNLPQLVEQVVTTLRAELEKKRLRFELRVEPHLPQVIADRERVSQVFENLIINAMKFTPEQGVIGVYAARRTGAGRGGVEVRVRDTGIGIPRAQLDKIFNRFYQVDGSSTRRVGGVGLGLSIVKIILEGHGSSISVDSQEGQGTEFRFTLPALERPAPDARPARGEGRVLVVDRQPEFLATMRAQLEAEGFEVQTAATPAEGAELAARLRPDAIVLDAPVADPGGLGLTGIPVVLVSGRSGEGDEAQPGAPRSQARPFDVRALVAEIRHHALGRHAGTSWAGV